MAVPQRWLLYERLQKRREAGGAGVGLAEEFGGVPAGVGVMGMAAGAVIVDQLEGKRALEMVCLQTAGDARPIGDAVKGQKVRIVVPCDLFRR